MRKLYAGFFLIASIIGGALLALSQQPQCPNCPAYAVNASWINGGSVGGYALTAGSGLTLNVGAGTAFCANAKDTYAGGTLSVTNNTTNYVYLDLTSSCAPAFNTSGYVASTIPLGTVVTSGGVITTITVDATMFKGNSNNTSAVTTTGSPANGNLVKFSGATTITNGDLSGDCTTSGTLAVTCTQSGGKPIMMAIAHGTVTLGTSAISSGACGSAATATATGATTTDNVIADFNADPTSTTGYQAGAMLTIVKWVSSAQVNFKQCNNTGSSITPSAVTLNWIVARSN